MVVVSDTSPLINLAAIDHLWLIPKIYGQVIIPQAVFNEIVVEGIWEPGAAEIQSDVSGFRCYAPPERITIEISTDVKPLCGNEKATE